MLERNWKILELSDIFNGANDSMKFGRYKVIMKKLHDYEEGNRNYYHYLYCMKEEIVIIIIIFYFMRYLTSGRLSSE